MSVTDFPRPRSVLPHVLPHYAHPKPVQVLKCSTCGTCRIHIKAGTRLLREVACGQCGSNEWRPE